MFIMMIVAVAVEEGDIDCIRVGLLWVNERTCLVLGVAKEKIMVGGGGFGGECKLRLL